jgi:peptide/nickel transport system permease protein
MSTYLIRRFFQMIIVVLLASFAIYMLLNIAPGGPLSGLRLSSDRKSRVSDQDIARLSAYLGLDKPLWLRYFTWLTGDDWLGADWMYVGLSQFKQPRLGRDGSPMYKIDTSTGVRTPQYESTRFWIDPGVVLFNPTYRLWVWGEEVAPNEFRADVIRVNPPITENPPSDVVIYGEVLSKTGQDVTIVDNNNNKYVVTASRQTKFQFPAGMADPRPADGSWLNISWLTGVDGLLAKYSGFHGPNSGMLRMDFGFSWKLAPGQSVSGLIMSRLGNTLTLMITAVFLSLLIGIPIGIYSAVHQYSKIDYVATTFAFFGSAMPVFWFGLMLILVFTYQFQQWGLPFMPSKGVYSVREAPTGSLLALIGTQPGSLIDRITHLIMPAIMLSLLYMAGWSRYSRSSMLEVLRQDYVRTARAKGLFERVVIVKHALRNALIPVVTILVFDIAAIFSGAILTETIFSYPGMGRLYFDALGSNDWPVAMAYLFIVAVLVVIATLIRDIVYTIVDPRIRFT